VPIEAALWSKPENVMLADPDSEKWAFAVRASAGNEAGFRGVTVEGLMQEFAIERIDLLKLDIEGAEKEIFGSGTTCWLDRVEVIAIELHDRYRPGCAQAFYSALHGRNYLQEIRGENIFIRLSHDG
jgi:FkbM family methyltransferase